MLIIQNLKIIITKYFYRIFLFLFFYHGLIRPLQIIIANYNIKPLIEKKVVDTNSFELKTNEHHFTILHKFDKKIILHFSIPFGQAYFFLMFFLWFKPKNLTIAMSIFNLSLVPIYTLGIVLFLNGYFILGPIITLNEKFYRLMYGSILLLRIISRKQFYLIFDSIKK